MAESQYKVGDHLERKSEHTHRRLCILDTGQYHYWVDVYEVYHGEEMEPVRRSLDIEIVDWEYKPYVPTPVRGQVWYTSMGTSIVIVDATEHVVVIEQNDRMYAIDPDDFHRRYRKDKPA